MSSILYPSEDTEIYNGAPNNNYDAGTQGGVYLSGDDEEYVFKVSLTGLPDPSQLLSATFNFWPYNRSASTGVDSIHRLLSGNNVWTAALATWNHQDGAGNTDWAGSAGARTSGTDYSSTAMGTMNIADMVQDQYNTINLNVDEVKAWLASDYGLIFHGTTPVSAGQMYMYLKGSAHEPYLELTYNENVPPNTPSITAPTEAQTGRDRNTPLTGDAFSDDNPSDTHQASQWQVATDSGFSNVVWDSGTDTTNKTSTTVNTSNGTFAGVLSGLTKLAMNTTYYVRVRYQDNNDAWSDYSTGVSFVTWVSPTLPTNADPANDATAVERNPTLQSSAFASPDGGVTHKSSQWQIFTDAACTAKVWDSGVTTSNKVSVLVNASNGTFSGTLSGETKLNDLTQYYWKVRHQDSNDDWTAYSTATNFTTVPQTLTGSSKMSVGGVAGISLG